MSIRNRGIRMAEHASAFLIDKKTARMLGFKTLLAWHYLVLFTPMFIGDIKSGSFPFFFERQFTLYLTLAVSFGVLALFGKRMLRNNKTMPSTVVLVVACVLATASSIVAIAFVGSSDAVLKLASTVFLGASEALLMFLWLHYYAVAAGEFVYRSFAVDMICGGLLAFLICILQYPFSSIVAVVLPLVAGISLVLNWQSVEPQQPFAPLPLAPAPSDREVMRHFLKTVLPTMVYAFVFGLLQGGYILSEVALLMAYDPLILLGILVCGILVFAIPEDPSKHSDIDAMHRLSMFLFVLGIVCLAFFDNVIHKVFAETTIFAGFNLFDYGAMILALGMSKRLRTKGLLFIEGGRALTYLSLALGIMAGERLMLLSGGDSVTLYTISGIAITLLVITSLTPFREGDGDASAPGFSSKTVVACPGKPCADCAVVLGKSASGGSGAPAGSKADGTGDAEARPSGDSPASGGTDGQRDGGALRGTPWKRTCAEIAKLYKLSPRETEIFLLIAKGRNAEYVQQQLVISTHTAKTHIANIYHKLGVHSSQEMLNLIEDYKRQGKPNDLADQ